MAAHLLDKLDVRINIVAYEGEVAHLQKFFADVFKDQKFAIIEIDDSFILDNKRNYEFIKNPLEYLFSVVIPLHFSQDIILNQKMWKNLLGIP